MAYIKFETDKKGVLQAKIQVSSKSFNTGKKKTFTKRIYNKENLSEAKFKRFVEKQSLEFEEQVADAYEEQETNRIRVLTFPELADEWKKSVKLNLSHNYYLRIEEVEGKFNKFLKERNLYDKPISDIKVRDVQLFLNEYLDERELEKPIYRLKRELPVKIKVRDLKHANNLSEKRARAICEQHDLYFEKYFEPVKKTFRYSQVTVKGYRTVLRTIFNEAIRYEWITKNPVCFTKISSVGNNSLFNAVSEKEVFSIKEAQIFLQSLDSQKEMYFNRVIPIKIMLLTGLRNGEIHGLKWSDIDFNKKVIHVVRSRLYSSIKGCYEKAPKTRTSVRDVPMPDYLINELLQYKDWFRMADKDFDKKLDEYYISVNIYREPINPTSLDKWLTDFEFKTGQKHVTCHGLRHTYCSLLLARNVPIQTVSKYMGHSDSTVTLKVYSHFIPDTQEIAINALNDILENEGDDE